MAARSSASLADGAAILILAVVAAAAAFTFRDYGLGWDDYTHSQYGELLVQLYVSGFTDQRALSFVNLYKYGGGFDIAAALIAKILPLELFEVRRLTGAIIGLVGLFITWRLGRRLGGPIAGLGALALLAACPLYYGHMFMNPKDTPFAVAMAALLWGIVWTLDGYPKPDARSIALTGVGLGAAFGSRILAVVAAPYVALVLLLIVITEARKLGTSVACSRLGQFIGALLPALVLAYVIMGALWPWSIVSPLNPLRAIFYFDTFFETPWKELYEGTLFSVPNMPWSYLPHLFLLILPIVMLIFCLIGMAIVFVKSFRRKIPMRQRAGLLVVALAPIVPIIIVMVTRPALYNGVRHFLFLVPPFAVLGGLAFAWLIEHAWPRFTAVLVFAVFAFGIVVPVMGMVRLHPYQYVFFNELAGGVRGAQGNYMLDYWGLAFKQAGEELRQQLAASRAPSPPERKWIVAVCGPQPVVQVELGPDFETTWKAKKADFVMSLGTFYCRDLDAPLLAEVKREGVVFARVYDVRGKNIPDLLTEPPP
jgi:hypothetical protein